MVKETSIKTTTTANKYFKSDIEKNNFNSNSDLYDFIYNSVNSLLTIEKQTISARSNNFLSLLLSHILNNLENRISEKNTTLKADKDSNKNKFENEISEKISKIIYEKINKKESSEKIESDKNKFIISSENISKEILEIFNSDEFKDEITTCINDNVEKHSKETLDIFKNNFENSVLENTSEFKEEISKKLSEEEKYIKNIEKFISTTSKLFQKKSNIVFNKNQIYGFEKNNSKNLNDKLSKNDELISTLENAKDNVKNQIDLTNKKLKKSDIVSNTSDINQISKKNLNKKFKTNSKSFLGFLPNLSKKVKEKNSNVNNSEKYLKKSFLGKSLHIPFKNFNKKNKKFFKDQEKKKTSFIGNLFTSIVKNKVFIFWSTVFITLLFRKAISAYDYVKDNFSDKESAKDWFHRQKEKILQIPIIEDIFKGFCKFKTSFDNHSTVKLLKWFIKNWGWLQYALLAGSILKTALDCGLGDILKKRFMDLFKKTRLWKSTSRFFTHLKWRIRDALRKGWNKFYTRIFKPVMQKVGNFFKNIWGNVSKILKKFKLSDIKAAISNAINNTWGHIKGVFSKIRDKFTKLSISGIRESIINWFNKQKNSLIENSKKIIQNIVKKLKLGPIIEKLTGIKNRLTRFAKALKRPLTFIKNLFSKGFAGIKKITSRIYNFAKGGIVKVAEAFAEKKLIQEFSEKFLKEVGENSIKNVHKEALNEIIRKSGKNVSNETKKKILEEVNTKILKNLSKNGTAKVVTKAGEEVLETVTKKGLGTVVGKGLIGTSRIAGGIMGAGLPWYAMTPLDSYLLVREELGNMPAYYQADDLIYSELNDHYKNFDSDLQLVKDVILNKTFLKKQKVNYGQGVSEERFEHKSLGILDLYKLTSDHKKNLFYENKKSVNSDKKLENAQNALFRIINFDDTIFGDDKNNKLRNLFKGFKEKLETIFSSKSRKFNTEENLKILYNNLKIITTLHFLLENVYKEFFPKTFDAFLTISKDNIIEGYNNLLKNKLFKKGETVKFSDIFNLLNVVNFNLKDTSENNIIKIKLGEILPYNSTNYVKYNPYSTDEYGGFHKVELGYANYFKHIFPTYKIYIGSINNKNKRFEHDYYDAVLVYEKGNSKNHKDDVLKMNTFLKHTGTFFKIGKNYTYEFPVGTARHNPNAFLQVGDLSLAMTKDNLHAHIENFFPEIGKIDLNNDESIDKFIKEIRTTYSITDSNLNDENFMIFFLTLLTKFMEAAKDMN